MLETNSDHTVFLASPRFYLKPVIGAILRMKYQEQSWEAIRGEQRRLTSLVFDFGLGHPQFLNDPCYPHDNEITLAHCTAPRMMDGKTLEAARIVTHFESDYGASPKVEMRKGQVVTNIIPDFAMERWVGLKGEIIDAPFRPICRSQIDIRFKADTLKVAATMPGFHWMTIYGDYLKEAGYALKKTKIGWENLG